MTSLLEPDDEIKNTVRELLATNKVLCLGTCASDRPWVAGAYFAETDPFHLTLILDIDSRSLANIRVNPNVAVTLARGPHSTFTCKGNAMRNCWRMANSSSRHGTPYGRKRLRLNSSKSARPWYR
jgi:hypothetical protein